MQHTEERAASTQSQRGCSLSQGGGSQGPHKACLWGILLLGEELVQWVEYGHVRMVILFPQPSSGRTTQAKPSSKKNSNPKNHNLTLQV